MLFLSKLRVLTAALVGICALPFVQANAEPSNGPQPNPGPVVSTADGPVRGFVSNGAQIFLGIPYAAPPVGDLRWRPPQPHAPWQQVLDATQFGPICLQTATNPFSGPANQNEDCLFLNVFAPEGSNERLPVIVFIHGGGNSSGESTGYDGTKMAVQGRTVVVTMNYRLGVLGGMAHPAIDAEGHPFANYDILDQQFVLKWVQRNITRFGGDPDNITVGGQSAGSADAESHVMSPLSKGLFHRAILESHVYEPTALSTAEAQGVAFAVAAGCGSGTTPDVAACLRALPAAQIFTLDSGPFHSEIIGDGQIIPDTAFSTLIQEGQFNHVPLISGTVQDEENFGLAGAELAENPPAPFTATDYENMINGTYVPPSYPAGTAARLMATYPLSNYATPQLAIDAFGTDFWSCTQRQFDQLIGDQVSVYAYEFDDRTAPSYYPALPGLLMLAYHTGDIQYLFPGYHGSPTGIEHKLNFEQGLLSDELVALWTTFAWTGNPNGRGNFPWPAYEPRSQNPLILSEGLITPQPKTIDGTVLPPPAPAPHPPGLSTMTDAGYSAYHHCDFWDSVAPFSSILPHN